jgi:Zn-dependent protease
MSSEMQTLVTILGFVTLLYSIIAHEVAHGWVALKCGDPTALHQGRLTANPIPHIDPMMSIVVPILSGGMFGAAKPVPVNPRNFRRWTRDTILVSLAGVATNLLIAIACAGLARLLVQLGRTNTVAFYVLIRTVVSNVALMVFNLLPVPPLDGSRAFRFLLPIDLRWKYDELYRYGFMPVFVLVLVLRYTGLGEAVGWFEEQLLRLLLGN